MVKSVKRKKKRVVGPRDPWFKRREGNVKSGWGFGPVDWKGGVSLVLLVAVNVFAAQYFDIMNSSFREVSKFLVVFFLSLAIFILIAKKKTKGVKA